MRCAAVAKKAEATTLSLLPASSQLRPLLILGSRQSLKISLRRIHEISRVCTLFLASLTQRNCLWAVSSVLDLATGNLMNIHV